MGKLMRMTKSTRERTPFGQRMYEARRRSGLTQGLVCAGLGITQGTLSGLESTGQGSRRVAEFARIYHCDAEWLATGKGSPGWSSEPAPRPESPQRVVSEQEWLLLQDVRMVLGERELTEIRARASVIREQVEHLVRQRMGAHAPHAEGAHGANEHMHTEHFADPPGLPEELVGGRSHFGELDESLTRPAPAPPNKRLRRI